MRMFKKLFNPATIVLRTRKKILYETIDLFNPKHVYTVKKYIQQNFVYQKFHMKNNMNLVIFNHSIIEIS